ncbi:MAG: HAD family hydrolase [Planctomycetota bacterium]|nr:HAD family hydrolase [Planctomycetota bacterium]
MNAAVFLDRDGTLITESRYLSDPDQLRLQPGAGAAVGRLNGAGLPVVVITNQSGVARGLFDEQRLAAVHRRLESELASLGARLDLILHCPHHPEIGAAPYRKLCDCRKPEPGLLLEAARRLDVDLSASWMVGDSERDIEAGRRAGVGRLVLVATGQGTAAHERLRAEGRDDYAFLPDLLAVVDAVVAQGAQGR